MMLLIEFIIKIGHAEWG